MCSTYLDPEDEWEAEPRPDEASAGKKNKKLETKGPQKDKKFKVLHQDGSLADIPYHNGPAGGAPEGKVGTGK
jgi:hypothetical protein